ncbi:MAG: hypothetical protein MUF72_05035 [Elainella sp. Prado103]|nr:hypothetical protein [Elainella sp. Prado103]
MVESPVLPDYQQVLMAVAQSAQTRSADRPTPNQVIEALIAAEKATKHQHRTYTPDELIGQWRLYFATGVRKRQQGGITLGRGFYLPGFVQAQIGFDRAEGFVAGDVQNSEDSNTHPPAQPLDETLDPAHLQIRNQLRVGLFRLGFLGPARYRSPKNLLAFDFTQIQFDFLTTALYHGKFRRGKTQTPFEQRPIAQLPFFSFFLVTDQMIAARGRGGGLAIWTKA